jgi:hypothetical protein
MLGIDAFLAATQGRPAALFVQLVNDVVHAKFLRSNQA